MDATIPFRYTARPDKSQTTSLTLEPEYVDTREALATLADVDAMLSLARRGVSARNRQLERCRWARWADNGDLLVSLMLYVWPSDTDLAYTLDLPPQVTSSEPVLVRLPRRQKIWVSGSQSLTLPWLLEPDADLHWHASTGALDSFSRPTSPPALEVRGVQVRLSAPVYGVLSVTGTAIGWQHQLTARFSKFDGEADRADGLAISRYSADSFQVTAGWADNGEPQEESAEITFPACVRSLLETCSDGKPITSLHVNDKAGSWYEVRYSTCDGSILGVIRHEAEDKEEKP